MTSSSPYALLAKMAARMPGIGWLFNIGTESTCVSSASFREFLGVFPEGDAQRHVLSLVHLDDRAAATDLFNAAVDENPPRQRRLRCLRHDSETYCWFDCAFMRHAQPLGAWTLRIIDVDSAMKAELELRSIERRKDEFIAMLGHELRNPLAPIRTACAIARGADPGDRVLREIDLIDAQARAMVRLIDDLLDNSRLAFDKLKLQRSRIELRKVCEDAVHAFMRSSIALASDLRCELPDHPVFVQADPQRLHQTLSNLLRNAVTYSPPASVVSLRLFTTATEARISVTDQGIGLQVHQFEQIFEPFEQQSAATDGLGLGLSLARQLMRLQGGRLDVLSAGPGRGSTFTACLPLAFETPLAPPSSTDNRLASRPVQSVSQRILVVDDNAAAADSLCLMLQSWGYDCRPAYDGRAALHEARSFDPDVLLLDISMPGLNGRQLARLVRLQPRQRPVTVVAISGYEQPLANHDDDLADFDAYLTKPADPHRLRRLLEQLDPLPAPL